MIRVVLDTNIITSATILAEGHSSQVLDLWEKKKIEVVLSPPILEEIEDVLNRPRIVKQQWMTREEVQLLLGRLRRSSIITPAALDLRVVQDDPDDDKFIVAALEGDADYIASGDPHLKRLKEYRGIKILSPAEFLDLEIMPKS